MLMKKANTAMTCGPRPEGVYFSSAMLLELPSKGEFAIEELSTPQSLDRQDILGTHVFSGWCFPVFSGSSHNRIAVRCVNQWISN